MESLLDTLRLGYHAVTSHCGLSVLLVGMLFTLFEAAVLNGPARKWLRYYFKRSGQLTDKQVDTLVNQAGVRITADLHLLIQVPLALLVLADPAMIQDRLYSTTRESVLLMTISAGYFLHDLLICLLRFEGIPASLHGAACCLMYAYAACSGHLHYYGAMFLMWELSTPCVHVRWFLYKAKQTQTRLYLVNGITMIITFFLCRNVWGLVTSVDFWLTSSRELASPHPNGLSTTTIWLFRAANVLMNGLNTFWMSKMASGAMKLLMPARQKAH